MMKWQWNIVAALDLDWVLSQDFHILQILISSLQLLVSQRQSSLMLGLSFCDTFWFSIMSYSTSKLTVWFKTPLFWWLRQSIWQHGWCDHVEYQISTDRRPMIHTQDTTRNTHDTIVMCATVAPPSPCRYLKMRPGMITLHGGTGHWRGNCTGDHTTLLPHQRGLLQQHPSGSWSLIVNMTRYNWISILSFMIMWVTNWFGG